MFAKRLIGNDSGSVAIEFAMIVPAFIGLIFAGFFAGWTSLNMHSVHYSLTKAGRALQLNPSLTQSDVQKLVSDYVSNLSGSGSGITVTLSKGASSSGTKLDTATASYPLTFTIPLIGTYTYTYTTSVTVVVAAS